jgi:Domain of unknown function (DUF4272)
VKGEGIENQKIEKLVEKYEIANAFSPKERKFIDDRNPTKHDRIQFAWRYELLLGDAVGARIRR